MSAKSLPALGLEKEYGEKIDRCITDTLLKAGGGLLVGGVVSFLLFKRRAWPMTLGTGIGLGIAYRNCEDNLRSHYLKKAEESILSPVETVTMIEKIDTTKVEEHCEDCDELGHETVNLEEVKLSETLVTGTENPTEQLSESEEDNRNMLNKNF